MRRVSIKIHLLLIIFFIDLAHEGTSFIIAQGNTGQEMERINPMPATGTEAPALIIPSRLPEWFSNIPPGGSALVYAIGVSDPGLEKKQAIRQALHRAGAMAALASGAKVDYVADVYSNEKYQGGAAFHVEELIKIKSSSGFISYEIIDSGYTRFREVILLVAFKASREAANARVILEKYSQQVQVGPSMQRSGMVTFLSEALYEKVSTRYKLSFQGKKYELTSEINDTTLKIPMDIFKYVDTGELDSATSANMSAAWLYGGLWGGILEALSDEIIFLVNTRNSKIKNMNDLYQQANEDLMRDISCNFLRFSFQKIIVNENKIYMDISRLE